MISRRNLLGQATAKGGAHSVYAYDDVIQCYGLSLFIYNMYARGVCNMQSQTRQKPHQQQH